MNTLNFSDRLQAAMKAEGLTQADLARKIKLTKSAINQVVSGTTKGMKPENLVAVARALRVRVEWLATGEEPMRPEVFSPLDREILQYLHAIPDTQRKNMVAVIRDMASVAYR
jgi:transcriptional regulator with XRE-family HTH domain